MSASNPATMKPLPKPARGSHLKKAKKSASKSAKTAKKPTPVKTKPAEGATKKKSEEKPQPWKVQENGCWKWTGYFHNRTGLPEISVGSKKYRKDGYVPGIEYAYEQTKGSVPADKTVAPACPNGLIACVNPAHSQIVEKTKEARAKKVKAAVKAASFKPAKAGLTPKAIPSGKLFRINGATYRLEKIEKAAALVTAENGKRTTITLGAEVEEIEA